MVQVFLIGCLKKENYILRILIDVIPSTYGKLLSNNTGSMV